MEKATIEVIEVLVTDSVASPDHQRGRLYSRRHLERAISFTTLSGGRARPTTSRSLASSTSTATAPTTSRKSSAISSEMGVIVDAYFDLSKRQWVGADDRADPLPRRRPIPGSVVACDPNRDEKTKLIDAMSQAVEAARQKRIQSVNFRDFFPRMGYRVKLDVPDDKINQATAPYLTGVKSSDCAATRRQLSCVPARSPLDHERAFCMGF